MSLGSNQRGGVDFWRYAQHEFAGSGLFGCLALLFAYGDVSVFANNFIYCGFNLCAIYHV